MSSPSAWGKSISQKRISLWTKWREVLCNLKPKSNQRSVNGPTEGCWPAFACVFPSSVPGHLKHFRGLFGTQSSPALMVTCLLLKPAWFRALIRCSETWAFSRVQAGLICRADSFVNGWWATTELHPAAAGTADISMAPTQTWPV